LGLPGEHAANSPGLTLPREKAIIIRVYDRAFSRPILLTDRGGQSCPNPFTI
jgi:hypothetical protein